MQLRCTAERRSEIILCEYIVTNSLSLPKDPSLTIDGSFGKDDVAINDYPKIHLQLLSTVAKINSPRCFADDLN